MFTEQRARWIYDQYGWLERCLPGRGHAGGRRLIVPTKEFFPDRYLKDAGSASLVFNRVRSIMGIADWDCELVEKGGEQAELNDALGKSGILGYTSARDAAGTFQKHHKVTITYAPGTLKDPLVLVATLAHELSHYLLAETREPPTCAQEEMEPLTDLTTVAEGFGLFSCYASFQFKQWTDAFTLGWSVKRLGYLTEPEFAFALGIFCIRNGIDPSVPARYLRLNPQQVFFDSLDFISELDEGRASNGAPKPSHEPAPPPAERRTLQP